MSIFNKNNKNEVNKNEFKIEINEYNVACNLENRNSFILVIYDKDIQINEEYIKKDVISKVNKIKELISNNLEEIKTLSNERANTYKGGRQQQMHINFEKKQYVIIGNCDNKKISEKYLKLKNDILKIIK